MANSAFVRDTYITRADFVSADDDARARAAAATTTIVPDWTRRADMLDVDAVVATTLAETGVTVDVTNYHPRAGYCVGRLSQGVSSAGVTNGIIVDADVFAARGAQIVRAFVAARADLLRVAGVYLGTWMEDGVVSLDIVDVVADREFALALGRAQDQIAIYDIARGVTIPTGGTGGREDLAAA